MKKIVIIALSVLLATAIISNIASYRKYRDTKTAFERSEKKAVSLKEKIDKLEQQISLFEDQIRKNAKKLEELGVAKTRVSELGNIIGMKNQSLLEYQEKIDKLESNYRAEKEITENLRAEISSKTTKIHKLEDRVRSADTQVLSFTEQLTRSRYETEGLQGQVSDLSDQKSALEAKLKQQESAHETDVAGFNVEIQNRDARIGELQGKLERAKAQIVSIEDRLEKERVGTTKLQRDLLETQRVRARLNERIDQTKSTYLSIVNGLEEEIENREVIISELEEELSVTFVDRILFQSGKATVTPKGREILTKVGQILGSVKSKRIRVEGHTDNKLILPEHRHKFPSNWELSAARAVAVVRYFQNELGFDPSELEASGHSFYKPIATNETEEGRAQNRRVNIIIAPTFE